jgi:ABC-type nitrate/sulfonate/bicarbonate transport system permease component
MKLGSRVAAAAAQTGPAIVTSLLLLLIWQAATSLFDIPNWLLPAPSRIAAALWQWRSTLVSDIGVTLWETIVGFIFALLGAIPIAAALVSSSLVWRAFYPILAAFQSIPKNAIAPILILWFGTGQLSKIVIAFLISFFPIVINAVAGMQSTDSDAMAMLRSIRANRWQILWHLRLPNAIPYIFAAAKVSITLALVGAVIGEFVGADSGLGYVILLSSSQLKTDLAFAAITLLALIGVALFSMVGAVEKLFTPWAPQAEQLLEAPV